MQYAPPETSELQAFVCVVQAGSVSGAAKELKLPRATVSRRLARLEERLGVRLVHRTTRRLSVTELGEELYGHARSIVEAVEVASEAVSQDDETPRGLLRVSVPPTSGNDLADMLLEFMERHPAVELEVIVSTAFEDLIARNIDVAWRAGAELDPGLIARKISSAELVCVASPDYLERAGTPSSPDDLTDHACLVGFTRGERPATHWPLREGGKVRVRGRLASNDLGVLRTAALRGKGIALMPGLLVQRWLESGELVRVLPDALGIQSTLAVVFPERRLLKPAVRAFVDHAVAWSLRSSA